MTKSPSVSKIRAALRGASSSSHIGGGGGGGGGIASVS